MPQAEPDQPCGLHLFWDEAVTAYDFGPGHPMDPTRLALTMRLVEAFGLTTAPGVTVRAAPPAGDSTLQLVHRAEYVAAVHRAGGHPEERDERHGLGTEDNPVFPAMHDRLGADRGSVGGRRRRGLERPGRSTRSTSPAACTTRCPAGRRGFCVYNDAAIAIARLLELGAERVAYVDVDVHHGDGVQHAFWDDPRVLTISLHETARTLFPGTGWPDETGGERRRGYGGQRRAAGRHRRRGLAARLPRASCRRCSRASVRRSWSASTAATPTAHDPLAHLELTRRRAARRRTPPCTSWPTSTAAGAGWRSAAAATRWSRSSRGPGRTWCGVAAGTAARPADSDRPSTGGPRSPG